MEFPQPLFEACLHSKRMCLICGGRAESVLRTTDREIVPICARCSGEWNFYGYRILKKIRLAGFLRNLTAFKLVHMLRRPAIWTILGDLRNLLKWAKQMRKWSQ